MGRQILEAIAQLHAILGACLARLFVGSSNPSDVSGAEMQYHVLQYVMRFSDFQEHITYMTGLALLLDIRLIHD
jgi:hypothetical protein